MTAPPALPPEVAEKIKTFDEAARGWGGYEGANEFDADAEMRYRTTKAALVAAIAQAIEDARIITVEAVAIENPRSGI